MRPIVFAFAVAAICTVSSAFACQPVSGLNDLNCDGIFKMVVIGDSIVAGIGDIANGNRGGYVLRLQEHFPDVVIRSLGYPGAGSGRLLQNLKASLYRPGSNQVKRALKDADVVLIDVGRNDYWAHNGAGAVVTNITRIQKLIRARIGLDVHMAPYVVIASLLPTKRLFQRTFIAEVNDYLDLLNPDLYHVDVRFDRIRVGYISFDGIHPTPAGYRSMERSLRIYVKGRLQTALNSVRRPDATPTPTATPMTTPTTIPTIS